MIQKARVAIALGSNLGDRLGQIQKAIEILKSEFLENAWVSSVYETAPWGIVDQPPFLNAVVVGESEWKAPAIVNYLKNLEMQLGRQTRVKNGPREIDLDLLAVGDQVCDSVGVTVPHPGIADRDFVLVPLKEVWPDWVHPVLKLSVLEMCEALGVNGSTP